MGFGGELCACYLGMLRMADSLSPSGFQLALASELALAVPLLTLPINPFFTEK